MDRLGTWLQQFLLGDAVVLMVIMVLVIGLLEHVRPARKVPFRHYAFNTAYGLITILITSIVAPLIGVGVAYAIQAAGIAGLIDLSALGLGGLGGAMLAMLLATFIFDFFFYWMHRLEHANALLWQEHVIHHSDEYLNVTTASRGHFLDGLLLAVFVSIPMALLFKLPPVTIGLVTLVPAAWLYVVHANLRIGFGPLWWLLVSPNYHRIHHSLEREHIDKNFANWFPVWDILFGTAVHPRAGECPATGVAGVAIQSVPRGLLFPFAEWGKMLLARSTAGGARPGPPTRPSPDRASRGRRG